MVGLKKGNPGMGLNEEEKVGKVVKVGAVTTPVFKSQQPAPMAKASASAQQVIGLINKKQPQVANFAEGEENIIK